MTAGQVLDRAVERWPDEVAIIFRGEETNYRELGLRSDALAWALRDLGLRPGDRVAVMAPNCLEWSNCYFGIGKAGLVLVPINVLFKEDEAHYILENSGARAIVVYEAFEPLVEAIQSRLPDLEHVIVLGEAKSAKAHNYAELLKRGFGVVTADPGAVAFKAQVKDEDLLSILYTSGTTGRPKGAMLTHRNVTWDAEACSKALPVTHEDVWLCALPMFHTYAETTMIMLPAFVGSKVVIAERFIPDTIMRLIEEHKVTTFPGVPAMYATFLQVPREGRASLDSLKFAVSGGAPMPVETLHAFEKEFDLVVLEGDGPTECSPVTSVNPWDRERKPGSVGLPLPGVEIKIFDDKDNEVPTNEVGEIVVRGQNVMKGYWKMPEATAEALKGGWMHTGDLGKIDEDGYVYILDRKKDMVLVGGLNVYPREVEEVLYAHPAVLQAAVIGVADRLRGEAVKAFIVPRPGMQVSERDIRAWCRQRLAVFKVPRLVEFRSELPMSNTGKVLKRELREQEKHG